MELKIKNKYNIAVTLLLISSSGLAQQNRGENLNFVIINLDDAGYGDFSHNGALGYMTPNIDDLANEGMRFTHFLVAQPVSGASRTALLTGCYPNRIGMPMAPWFNSPYGINEKEVTLAELFKEKGYRTALYGKWHLGDANKFLPLQHGFDDFYGIPFSHDMWPYHPLQERLKFPDLPLIEGNDTIAYNADPSQFTTDFTKRAVKFIKKNKRNNFFLYLAHPLPHAPLAVSDKFEGKSERGLYGDVMMEIDWSVGEVMKALRNEGLDDNTIVILTSDNGPWRNYGNHGGSTNGFREGKGTTFEGGNRVPCIIYWKDNIAPGSICNKLVANMDIYPTIADIINAPLPDHKIDGVSILPLLKGDIDANPRTSFAYYYQQNDLEAVTDGAFKLVFPHKYVSYEMNLPALDGEHGTYGRTAVDSLELYDLRIDPGESNNVINLYPDISKKLQEMAESIRYDLGDNLTGVKPTGNRPSGKVK